MIAYTKLSIKYFVIWFIIFLRTGKYIAYILKVSNRV